MAYKISDKCEACGLCQPACPVEAIKKNQDKKFLIEAETCVGCGVCVDECPHGAIVEL